MHLLSKALGVGLLAAAVGGCERGCLGRWLGEHGLGGASPGGSGRDAAAAARGLDLFGTDCSDGLLRCVDGNVEASRTAHLSAECQAPASPEKRAACACPWEPMVRCASGCVDEGLEVIAPRDAGAQLCRSDVPAARPLLATEVGPTEICASEGLACVDEIVRICDRAGQPARLLGRCLHGCQPGITVDHGEATSPDGVLWILCRRDHAERQ